MCDNFVHLHSHTDASTLDGLGTVKNMISTVKSLGQNSLAMTDHGTLSNSIIFSMECQENGIKPILGLEGYIILDGKIGHITLLADGELGWRSLVDLNNLAQSSLHKRPAFSVDQLVANSKDLLCFSGCISSPMQRLSFSDSLKLGSILKASFGERLFAEIMCVDGSETWERSIKLSETLKIPLVMTNDCHFHKAELAETHKRMTNLKGGFEYESDELYLKSRKQMEDAAKYRGISDLIIEKSLSNTQRIANRIRTINLKREPKLPSITKENLVGKVFSSKKWLEVKDDERYEKQAKYELGVILDMGFKDYFLILSDIIDWAKSQEIKVGPGRGSGAGSLILYLLGVTELDPLQYGLSFERFLNPKRVGMPDVDVDFDSSRRDEVIKYVSEKYGAYPIATYSRYSHKSLVRDLGKSFSLPKELIEKVSERGSDSKEFLSICDENEEFKLAYDTMLGQIRHKGKHPGGAIITEQLVPLERVGDVLVTGWTEGNKSELSYAGIVKYDLLGVSTLQTLANLEKITGVKPDKPKDGSPVFEIFRIGDLSGIFQFSGSDGIRKLTMDLQPTTFNDLVSINALYRPGTLDAGVADHFVDWKKKPRELPDIFKDALEDTYGAIVFQEQTMELFRLAVKGEMADADNARRILANFNKHPDDPKYIEGLNELHQKFVYGLCSNYGFLEEYSESWWSEIETHARYSFNRAHAAAYSMLAWQCAWFKFYYPAEFYAESLNTDETQKQRFVFDAMYSGIDVVPPSINVSSDRWVAKGGKIYAPFSAVKQLGPTAVNAINNAKKDGDFLSLKDFMKRVSKSSVRANARLNLVMAGAFNEFGEKWPLGMIEDLQIKKEKLPKPSEYNLMNYLGFIIPTRDDINKIKHYETIGYESGIVSSVDKRVSKWGPYSVYRLAPSGSFWSRDLEDKVKLDVGQLLAVKKNENTGRVKEIILL